MSITKIKEYLLNRIEYGKCNLCNLRYTNQIYLVAPDNAYKYTCNCMRVIIHGSNIISSYLITTKSYRLYWGNPADYYVIDTEEDSHRIPIFDWAQMSIYEIEQTIKNILVFS